MNTPLLQQDSNTEQTAEVDTQQGTNAENTGTAVTTLPNPVDAKSLPDGNDDFYIIDGKRIKKKKTRRPTSGLHAQLPWKDR